LQPWDDATNPRLGIPLSETLMPQIMAQAGYVTGMVGKWHLGSNIAYTPLQRGFQEFYGFLGGDVSTYYNTKVLRGTTPITETAYLTDAFTREAVSFINNHASQPFFLYVAYNAPHAPYNAPPDVYLNQVSTITNTQRKTYAAM